MKRTSGNASRKPPRSRPRDTVANYAIARSAAAVLGQLYQWRPGLKQTPSAPQARRPFDVQAAFDAVNKK
jgi:hypothetical protein